MRKFYQDKLWRDKLIAIREAKGAIVHTVPLSDGEYNDALCMKLIEESEEVFAADDHSEMKEEIADILEAIDCLLALHGISHDEILNIKNKKRAEFGSYSDKRLVDYAEYPAGSAEELKCLENSDRYPELVELEEGDEDLDESDNECCK